MLIRFFIKGLWAIWCLGFNIAALAFFLLLLLEFCRSPTWENAVIAVAAGVLFRGTEEALDRASTRAAEAYVDYTERKKDGTE